MRTGTLALCLVFVGWASLCSIVPDAAAQDTTATVRGVVRDISGAIVPGATVTAQLEQAGAISTVQTDPQGRYDLSDLPPGPYVVQATLPGFDAAVVSVRLAAGDTRTFDLTLEPAAFLESVTVTRAGEAQGTVPQAVTVVTQDAIQFGQRRDLLSEALRGTPGLFIENRRNYSLSGGVNAAIRAPMIGFDMRGVAILQDGIPLTTADGTTQPTNLDLGSAGRIEIVRGPSSVLYGNSAGGVISVQTEFPSSAPLVIAPDVQLGSYGYDRLQVKLGGTSGRVSYLVNISRMDVAGFRMNSAAEVRRANFIVRHAVSANTEVRGIFNLFDQPFAESASTLNEADARNNPTSVRGLAFTQGWGERARQGQGGIAVEHAFDNGHLFKATGWGQWRSLWNPIPFRIIDLGRKAGGLRTEYGGSSQLAERALSWTAGVDLSFQRDDRVEYRNGGVPAGATMTTQGNQILDQGESVNSYAPFIQARLALDDHWWVTGGIRYDYFDFSATDHFLGDGDQSGGRTLDAFSPMVGVTFAANPNVNLYANVATAYQTPTTVELSNRPTGEGGFNDQLEPEDLRSFEVGARGTLPEASVRFEIAAYFSTLNNAFVELQRPDEQTYFANAATSSRNGLEMQVNWQAAPDLDTYVSYTFQNFTFDHFSTERANFSGNREPGAPEHQLFLGTTYADEAGFRSAVQVRWVDAYPVNNANTSTNWSYQIVDARVGWDGVWNGIAIQPFLSIENLLDQRYNSSTIPNAFGSRYYEPSPGREFLVGMTISAGLL
jgi:iron complex outermembrane receptor protein